MDIVNRRLAEIHPYENNPRFNDEAVDAVAASIQEFGFKVPIVLDSEGVIVAGHTRWKAALKLQLETVPCVVADDLTPEQIKALEAVRRFYEANRDLDVDYIVFRPKESTGGKDYSTPEAMAEATEIIQAVRDLQEGDERVTLNFKWGLLGRTFERCAASWAQIAVNERGEVMYCCHKPYEIVGHVLDWNILEKKESFRTNMAACDVPCRMTAPNIFVDQVTSQMEAPRQNSCFI